MDDGSTDGSAGVARSFGERITLVEQENSGVVAARNNGFQASRGSYVGFLDADDVLEPSYVERLVDAFAHATHDNVAVSYCDFRAFGAASMLVRGCEWNPRKLLYRNYIVVSALIRREAFIEVGGYSTFDHTDYSFEDWDLWLKLVDAGYAGTYTAEPLHLYRVHGAGRNVRGFENRSAILRDLRRRHPKLYRRPSNVLYLLVMGNLSRLRNALVPSANPRAGAPE